MKSSSFSIKRVDGTSQEKCLTSRWSLHQMLIEPYSSETVSKSKIIKYIPKNQKLE